MNKKELHKQLVERYINGEASAAEVEVFFHLLNKGELDECLEGQPDGAGRQTGSLRRLGRYGIAAAVILLAGLGVFLWLRPVGKQGALPGVNVFKNEVVAGGNKALLTLADGSNIVLDSAEKGQLTNQGNARIIKVGAGQLSYKAVQNDGTAVRSAGVYYNTISTPSGTTFQVVLADGTKVWLNAWSTLKFPTTFHDTARIVELTGEAYFEVAPLTAKGGHGRVPFKVNVAGGGSGAGRGIQVQVLGTHFNVKAYGDEPDVKTTLLEGSVRLVKGNMAVQLRPGEQGQNRIQADGKTSFLIVNGAVDVEKAMAWRNGLFSFEGDDIYGVMRQISRWYGVDVRYEGGPNRTFFGGEIGRDLSLTQVLMGLSKTNIHFRLEGKTLTVLP